MMKRLLPSLVILAATLGAASLMHCGGETEPGGEPTDEAGTSSSGSGTTGSGSSGRPNTSSSSSGGSGLVDSGPDSTSGGVQRIPTKADLPTRSPGCGNADLPGRGGYVGMDNGRYYIPYQPGNYDNQGVSGTGYPLMIALHGCYAGPYAFAGDYMAFQDQIGDGALVMYGVANNAEGSCGWDLNGDVAYLDALIADIGNRFCVDTSRVMLLGFSWGSYMAHSYACQRPGTVKAVVGGGGGFPNNYNASLAPAVCGQIHSLIYGRTADNDEGIGNSYNARDQRKAIANCGGADIGAPDPIPPADGSGSYCTEATGCDKGLRTTFCEDKFDFTSVGGQASYNHTIYKPWHNPMWQWFLGLP